LILLAVGAQAQSSSQKPKRIYITLDVSGSMNGNKYILANYTAQSIAVLSDPDDVVSIYYLGRKHDINGANGYKQLQIPFNQHHGQNSYPEISDLTAFLKNYRPDPKYEDWLFIIGDGDWDYDKALAEYNKTTGNLHDLFEKGQLQVCYLQTGDKLAPDFAFTTFLANQNSPLIEIRRSDTTASSVLKNCTFFANKILGFSNTGFPLQQQGGTCVSFRSEFPLDHCLLVFQSDKIRKDEVKLTSVTCDDRTITFREKGNPSTKPLIQQGGQMLNGVVWELLCPQTIPAGATVKVCFNQEVKIQDLTLYPYVDVSLQTRPLSIRKEILTQSSPNVFKICNKDDHVIVKIIATDKQGHKFTPPQMQHMNVKINAGGQVLAATYCADDTTFQATLKMPDDSLTYFSTVESPGYFSRVSPVQTIVKSDDVCPPERIPLITLPLQQLDAVTFDFLRSGGSFGSAINDSLFMAVAAAGDFDERTLNGPDSWMYESAELSVDGINISIVQKPRNGFCECAFPDTLYYEVTLRSRNGIMYNGKLYEGFIIPVSVPVDKRAWAVRCKYQIIGILLSFLLFLYFIALLKKNRFHKGARIKNSYVVEDNPKEVEKNGRPLRKPGFGAWFSRWLNPFGSEQNTISFVRPKTDALTFTASYSKNRVLLSASSFNPKKMTIPNYIPNPQNDKRKGHNDPISVSTGTSIEIKQTQNIEVTRIGHLKFVTEGNDNEGGFRFFIVLLLIVDLCVFGFLAFTLIKGLI